MPIYEYKCNICHRKNTRFLRSIFQAINPTCSHCGSGELSRLPSAFAFHQSLNVSPKLPSFETMSDVDENDPASISEWVGGMRRDMGNDFGHDYDQILEESAALEHHSDDGNDAA